MTTTDTETPLETDPQKAQRLIQALGATADEVADTLRREGVKGEKNNGTSCPVASYLKAHGVEDVWVAEYYAAVDHVDVDLPNAVSAFIGDFDAGDDFQDLNVAGVRVLP